ncbi:retrovirus-related pol polyprotein from transposon TNT 1-94 [Tanacetum coccineum]
MTESPLMDLGFAVLVFSPGDDPIASTIQDGRVTVQQVQGWQGQSYVGNNAGGQAKVVKCYDCQGEGHMARQCTQPKRPRNAAWFREKAMLVEA